MKKKVIFAAIAAVALISVFLSNSMRVNETNINGLALANVEALSGNEVEIKNCDGGKDVCDAVLSGSTLYVFTYN